MSNKFQDHETAFLIEEFKESHSAYLEIIKQPNLIMRNVYLFYSGLFIILSYMYKEQNTYPVGVTCIIPIFGLILTYHYIQMLHNNRKRETRIYNKLNLIRGILLKNSSNTLIQSYIETKYGSTEIKKFELNHTQQARSIYVLIGIFYMWFTVLAYLYTKSINDKATVIMGYLVAIVVIYFVTIYIYKSYTIRESITDPAQK